jgi:CRP-like cAMP-binding protein
LDISQSALTRKLTSYDQLYPDDLSVLSALHARRRTVAAGSDLVYEGERGHKAYILAKGWVSSYKTLPDGSRQVIDFQIPGDFLGLRSLLLRTSDHSFSPLTEVEVSEIDKSELVAAFRTTPRLAAAILWATSRDEAMVVEHLVDIGRRDALKRTAHYLLELGARLKLVGMGTATGYDCPITQFMLADALGLSAVHLNRVLRQLREKGLLRFQQGVVTFEDREQLVALSGFDPGYLDADLPALR